MQEDIDLVAINSPYYRENTCHWDPMSCETVLRLQISLKEVFLNSLLLRVMKKYDKIAAV